MATLDTPAAHDSMRAEKRAVARNSVFAAVVITVSKLVVGFASGSLGVLSEALNSALDLVMTLLTWVSVRVSDKPADADHQYGHAKAENLSAFIQTGMLLLAAVWIIWEAFQRLFVRHVPIEPTLPVFAVLLGTIAIDFWRSRALRRIARRYDSQALEADALHFATDMWQVGVVILGLALVRIGDDFGIPWLWAADPIAAILVALMILWVSSRLARQTIDALLDAASPAVHAEVVAQVGRVPGVLAVDRARVRRAGNRYFADLTVALSRNVTFQRAEQVVDEVAAAARAVLPGADVVVHSVPRASATENIFDRVRGVAARSNFNVHDVSVQDLGGALHVELHLELPEDLALRAAHDVVTALEADIRSEVPEISSILTHIESEPATIETGDQVFRDPALEAILHRVAREFPEVLDMHDVVLKRVRGHIYLSCHCTMPDDLPLTRVHDAATALEIRFKQAAPQLFKVLIHTEPQSDDRR